MGRNFAALALACLLILAMGCAGEKKEETSAQPSYAPSSGSVSIPESPTDYTAYYRVDDNGVQTYKVVWASKKNLRMWIDGLQLFFLGSRAYSCSDVAGNISCFDISSRLSQIKTDELYPCQHLDRAEPAETVDIGSTKGRCYTLSAGIGVKRKICCTDRGVLAYDEQNFTDGKSHVEYLTNLSYSANYLDFLLPSDPQNAPE